MARSNPRRVVEDLPPDNAARIVLYDTMVQADREITDDFLDDEDLFERAIPRLRVLFPRELHVHGERAYVDEKIKACIEADVLRRPAMGSSRLTLGVNAPQIRYPDGTLHPYEAGLEAARERLEAEDNHLRRAGFNIRHVVRSPSIDKKSDRYRNLVESIRRVGFFDHYPITKSSSNAVIDGVAREAAAAEAGVVLKKHHVKVLPKHLDTPLNHAELVLGLNADRLSEEERADVHELIAERLQRPWLDIDADLDLTRAWRQAEPKEYDVKLDVKKIPYAGQSEPTIQVTMDGTRVMLRSVMQQAGLPEYRRDDLLAYVSWEFARTKYSGRKAHFVDVHEAIGGIERMQRERKRSGLKVYPAWNDVRLWLSSLIGDKPGPDTPSAEPPGGTSD